MIVSCPSCGTLYRHEAREAPRRARCSCCDGPVHLGSRRSYAVRASLSDDPGVRAFAAGAPGLVAAAARAAGAPIPAFPGTRVPVSEGVRRVGMDDPTLAPALETTTFDRPGEAPMVWTTLAPEPPAEPREEPAAPPETASRPTVGVRTAFVGFGVGSMCGLGLSTLFGGPVTAWWGGGACAGLGFALGVARWASRRS